MADPLAARAREIRVRHLPLDEFPAWEAAQGLEVDILAALREADAAAYERGRCDALLREADAAAYERGRCDALLRAAAIREGK